MGSDYRVATGSSDERLWQNSKTRDRVVQTALAMDPAARSLCGESPPFPTGVHSIHAPGGR